MLAGNVSAIRKNLKDYCDRVANENEILIITRKEDKHVVMIGLDEYNKMQKIIKNVEYLAKIDRGIEQMKKGLGKQHELIEVEEDE